METYKIRKKNEAKMGLTGGFSKNGVSTPLKMDIFLGLGFAEFFIFVMSWGQTVLCFFDLFDKSRQYLIKAD